MRHFSMLVLVEGCSDQAFLGPLLDRSTTDLLRRRVEPEVAVDVVVEELTPHEGSRTAGVAESLRRRSSPTVVAIHFDASTDVARERSTYYDPVVRQAGADWPPLVPLAPVREMEAWALADLGVLPARMTRSLDVQRLAGGGELSRPESLVDPKAVLRAVVGSSVRPRRRAPSADDYLPLLGERIPLDALRALPSFHAFETALTDVLDRKGWIR